MTDRPVEPFHPLDPNKRHNQPIFPERNHLQHILPGEYHTPIFASMAARPWQLPQHRGTLSAFTTFHFSFVIPFRSHHSRLATHAVRSLTSSLQHRSTLSEVTAARFCQSLFISSTSSSVYRSDKH
jgi:hypothetical protein